MTAPPAPSAPILGACRTARLPGAVVRLGWISLFADVGSEMATPLIPLYLGSLLAAPGLALGLIEGSAQALLALLTALSGWHSDRIRRRVPYVRWGYGLSIASKALLGLAFHWPVVLVLRAADRLGKGLRGAPRDAMVVDLTAERRGAAFGLHRAMDTAGALIGCLLAALLISLLPGRYRMVFALTAVPGAVALLLTLTLREPASHQAHAQPADVRAPFAAASRLPRAFWLAAGALWLFSLGSISELFLILRVREQGFSDTQALLAYALFNAVYAASSYPAGSLSDRLGRRRMLAVGWLLFLVTMSAAAVVRGGSLAWLFPVLGLHFGLTKGVGMAWVADHAPSDLRGTALGLFHLGTGVALFVGSALAGFLWDHAAPGATFAYAAGASALALCALPFVERGDRI